MGCHHASEETCSWKDCQKPVGSMSWRDHVLAVGRRRGTLTLYDIRTRDAIKLLVGHKQMLHSVKWNHDGTFLASSDTAGIVCIWDTRAWKSLLDDVPKRLRMRHQGAVKVSLTPAHPLAHALTRSNRPSHGARGNWTYSQVGACFQRGKSISGAQSQRSLAAIGRIPRSL